MRLSKNSLHGDHKLPLTQRQINRIQKAKSGINLLLSVSQLQHLEKTGGFIPLLALLPAIFGGLGAAGGLAGGIVQYHLQKMLKPLWQLKPKLSDIIVK